jgi:hypothetical protein
MRHTRGLLRRTQSKITYGGHYCVCRRYSATASKEEDAVLKGGSDRERYKKGRLFVSASEIANLINSNPHISVGDSVERLWEKNNRRNFTEALSRNKLKAVTQRERLKELGILELATSVVETDDRSEYQRRLTNTLKQVVTSRDRGIVQDFINTSRGIKQEKTTFESLKQKQPSVKLDTDGSLYQKSVIIPDTEVEYLISGYIDGVELNNRRIIEIKNRQNRLFNHVPLYEQVQCQAYLFLTGLTVCEHTESFQGRLQSTTLHFEPVFWNHILERLNKVILAFDHLLKDNTVQDNFLQTRQLVESLSDNKSKVRKGSSSTRSNRSMLYEEEQDQDAKESVK